MAEQSLEVEKRAVHFSEVERNAIVEAAQKTLWNEDSQDVAEALSYLRVDRGISDEMIKKFRFGYYPMRLKNKGHDWAGRLIMPLYDPYGDLVVLTSRDFRCGKTQMPHLHEEFNKKFFIYGIDVAKEHIIKNQKAIVVEGQFDTVCSHAYGINVTVGVLGSAFSIHHMSFLIRYCKDIFLVFDRDKSGHQNLIRSIKAYKEYGLESIGVRFIPVMLPKQKDPDDFLRKESKKEYLELLSEAKNKTNELGTVKYHQYLSEIYPEIKIEK